MRLSYRIIPNGVPKAGNNLIVTLLKNIPHIHVVNKIFPEDGWYNKKKYNSSLKDMSPMVPIDIDLPHLVPLRYVENFIKSIRPGESLSACHFSYSILLRDLFRKYNCKMILIIRDPRDVVVSQVFYTLRSPQNPLYNYYTKTLENFERQLIASITGTPYYLLGYNINHVSIAQRYYKVFGWFQEKNVLVIKFEDLIGEKGGGIKDKQIKSIRKILRFLGIKKYGYEFIELLAGSVFSSDSVTFRKGQIGDWKNYFSPFVKVLFKEIAGDVLIKLGYEKDYDW